MDLSRTKLQGKAAVLVLAAVFACAGAAEAQTTLPDAPKPQRGPGGITIEVASSTPLALTLDDAITRALEHNAQLKIDEQSVRLVQGQIGTAVNALLPSLNATLHTGTQQTDLAALGFKPSSLAGFGLDPRLVPLIVKVNTTGAQLNISQTIFNVPAYEVYRAAKSEVDTQNYNMLLTRGNVVLAVGTQYLRALADQAEIDNADALLKQDQEQLRQATERDKAGVGTRLDVVRAQVQVQTQQQTLISAQNTYAKDKISLNRAMGLPAGQELNLIDTVPLSDLAMISLEDAKKTAFERRKDYLVLLSQEQVSRRLREAVRYERLPTIGFNGFYGVLGETHGLYHGVFTAQGSVNFPIFREAQFRAEREAADASLSRLHNQIASLQDTMEEQIRASQLDVQAAAALVKVAQSNVELSKQELSDANDRYSAGVDDNLRVIEAQAGVAQAQTTLIEDEYQFNQAKLMLARNTGVVETQYKTYLGR